MAPSGSDSQSPVSLPKAEPSDSEEVARSLKLAQMLWEEGQQREAVRALQRGAAAAEEVGNDKRALSLARLAADLSAQLPPSVPPPATTPSSPPPSVPPPSSSPEIEVPILVAEPEPEPEPERVRPSTSASRPVSTPSPARVAPVARTTTPSIVPEKSPSKAPAAHVTNGASGLSFPVTSREVRVSVKRSALDETLFVVRPLASGAKAPAGSREAVLVFAEVDPE